MSIEPVARRPQLRSDRLYDLLRVFRVRFAPACGVVDCASGTVVPSLQSIERYCLSRSSFGTLSAVSPFEDSLHAIAVRRAFLCPFSIGSGDP